MAEKAYLATKINTDRNSVYLTPDGLRKIQDELSYLKITKLKEVAQRIAEVRDFGGQEENSEFDAAREEEVLIEGRIATLEQVLENAQLIKEHSDNIVTLGSTVVLQMGNKRHEFTIVGKMEANPLQKRVSNESPIGLALLGAQIGQSIEVKTEASKYRCKVLEIR